MTKLQQIAELKSKLERVQRDNAKELGAMERMTEELFDALAVKSLKEAKQKIALLQAKRDRLQTQRDDKLEEFQEKWKDYIQ